MRWMTFLRILALALWLPATGHCVLAQACGLELLACPHEAAHGSDPHRSSSEPDACSLVESGSCRSEEKFELPSAAPVFLLPAPELLQRPASGSVDLRPAPSTGPPLAPPTWALQLRAVSQPRSPSFVS